MRERTGCLALLHLLGGVSRSLRRRSFRKHPFRKHRLRKHRFPQTSVPQAPRYRQDAGSTGSPASAKVADWLASAIGQPPTGAREPGLREPVVKTEARATSPRVTIKLTPTERDARLEALASEIRTCEKCPLCAKRTQTVFARGTGSSGLCFVGGRPRCGRRSARVPLRGGGW